jgi:hypothetical protein
MKYLIKFLAIIGLVSMSQLAVAVDNFVDGDVLTADMMNAHVGATNANSDDITAAKQALRDAGNTPEPVPSAPADDPPPSPGDNLVAGPVIVEPAPAPPAPLCDGVLGGTGAGGGLIFLISTDGCKGLEASESDLNAGVGTHWGCLGTEVGASKESYGGGRDNTGYIIDAKCTDGVDDAADLAHAFAGGGLTDWYLPARDELEEMYAVIGPGADNAGGFKDDQGESYWASTEDSPDTATQVVFGNNGTTNDVAKNFNRFVRAVRIFNNTPPS